MLIDGYYLSYAEDNVKSRALAGQLNLYIIRSVSCWEFCLQNYHWSGVCASGPDTGMGKLHGCPGRGQEGSLKMEN